MLSDLQNSVILAILLAQVEQRETDLGPHGMEPRAVCVTRSIAPPPL